MPGRAFKALGLAAGAAATVAGAAYAAERVAARRLRRTPDSDDADQLVPPFDEIRSLPSHDGGAINVISRGDGPPIVLSHGVTLSVRTWVKQMESLPDAGFRTIAFDHRGHGASTVGEAGHTLDTLAADVRTVVEGLDLHDAVLVGHSMGGVAVQLFCLRYPEIAAERLAGIVLLSTLAKTHLSGNRRLLRLIDFVASATPDAGGVLGFSNLGLLIARIGFGKNPQPSHVELTRQMILACASDTRKASPSVLLGLHLSRELRALTVPTLVICGTHDVLTPPAEARRIARLIPGARLEMLEGAGHMAMLEQSDTVDRLITDFAHEVQHGSADGRSAEHPEQEASA
ncbi:MAG: alpha/beta fold hydrolase [Acidimicrobiia bacterium]